VDGLGSDNSVLLQRRTHARKTVAAYSRARDRKPEYPPYVDRSAATGKCCRENIRGKYPGRPNRQFLELWKMPGGFEAVLLGAPALGCRNLPGAYRVDASNLSKVMDGKRKLSRQLASKLDGYF
jgi:hypothetical protein